MRVSIARPPAPVPPSSPSLHLAFLWNPLAGIPLPGLCFTLKLYLWSSETMLWSLGTAEARGFSGMFSLNLGSASTVTAMYRCISVYVYIYTLGKFLTSHHNGKWLEENLLALSGIHCPSASAGLLQESCSSCCSWAPAWPLASRTLHQFGTKGMLHLLSPCSDTVSGPFV